MRLEKAMQSFRQDVRFSGDPSAERVSKAIWNSLENADNVVQLYVSYRHLFASDKGSESYRIADGVVKAYIDLVKKCNVVLKKLNYRKYAVELINARSGGWGVGLLDKNKDFLMFVKSIPGIE